MQHCFIGLYSAITGSVSLHCCAARQGSACAHDTWHRVLHIPGQEKALADVDREAKEESWGMRMCCRGGHTIESINKVLAGKKCIVDETCCSTNTVHLSQQSN